MQKFPRPTLVISRCLELTPCRYDGARVPFDFINHLLPHVKLLPVCPEVEIGLGTPREPIRLIRPGSATLLLQPKTGARLTRKMRSFAKEYLAGISTADGFILKSRSPSCGIRDTKIFPNLHATHPIDKGAGLFAEAVLTKFGHLAIEDEARLTSPANREHFLSKLFTLAAFRALKKSPTPRKLARFHDEYSPLLAAHSPKEGATRAEIAPKFTDIDKRLPAYEAHLRLALARPVPKARRGRYEPPFPKGLTLPL
ncbi:MAG: DUF1722 domain-containing protein [Nitrospinaceae bacterium]|nr:DUF1722 domain-containing protein [Nitrospinaceae bacterium]